MARARNDEPDEDEGDDYDAETDYHPDDPETYPSGVYADDDRALISCPYCRAEIDEESEQCPKCRMFLSKEDAAQPRERKSTIWIVLVILALLMAIWWALGGK